MAAEARSLACLLARSLARGGPGRGGQSRTGRWCSPGCEPSSATDFCRPVLVGSLVQLPLRWWRAAGRLLVGTDFSARNWPGLHCPGQQRLTACWGCPRPACSIYVSSAPWSCATQCPVAGHVGAGWRGEMATPELSVETTVKTSGLSSRWRAEQKCHGESFSGLYSLKQLHFPDKEGVDPERRGWARFLSKSSTTPTPKFYIPRTAAAVLSST